jgi:hypothetical protein
MTFIYFCLFFIFIAFCIHEVYLFLLRMVQAAAYYSSLLAMVAYSLR